MHDPARQRIGAPEQRFDGSIVGRSCLDARGADAEIDVMSPPGGSAVHVIKRLILRPREQS
jgi:hypothetical protein